jgi:hypothetical protein
MYGSGNTSAKVADYLLVTADSRCAMMPMTAR